MRICCTSDLHGHLPKIPDCDLLLLGGDYYPSARNMHGIPQADWFENKFYPWLEKISSRGISIIGVAGNHDFYFERERPEECPYWTYLDGSSCLTSKSTIRVHGDGHTPVFFNRALNLDEPNLAKQWDKIPAYTDILLLHGPPFGFGDISRYVGEGQNGDVYLDKQGKPYCHTGSPSLLKRIIEVQPKLVICGHIHSGFGRYEIGRTVLYNVAHVDERYKPVNKPVVIDL